MTEQQHPITPSPELVREWHHNWKQLSREKLTDFPEYMATQAARWGSDQELEACCEWFVRDWTDIETADMLRAARRPKPPSLKEKGLTSLAKLEEQGLCPDLVNEIRQALEQLND